MKRLREEDEPPLLPPARIFHFVSLLNAFKGSSSEVFAYAHSISGRWRDQVTKEEAYAWWLLKEVAITIGELPPEIIQNEIGPRSVHYESIRSDCGVDICLSASLLSLVITARSKGNYSISFTYRQTHFSLYAPEHQLTVDLAILVQQANSIVEEPGQIFRYRTDKMLLMRLKTVLDTLPGTELTITANKHSQWSMTRYRNWHIF